MMTPATPPVFSIQRSFDDFDALCEAVRHWDLDLRQLEPGRFSGETLQIGTDSVHISEARFRRKVLQRGAPPQELRTIGVPVDPEMRFHWRGHACHGSNLLVFPRGAELESYSDSNFHVYTCSFSEDLLASVCERLGLSQLDELRGGKESICCPERVMSELRRLLSQITTSAQMDANNIRHSHAFSAMTRELPQQLLRAIEQPEGGVAPVADCKREQAIKLALQFIEQHAGEAVTVRAICKSTSVSLRTLEYAFQDRFGVTPKSFLLKYRLNMVRKQLRARDRRTVKIADVANDWGFWHMGQFAADYRALFGELPSETFLTVALKTS